MLDEAFKQLFSRPISSHKYDYGHILVIGGSAGMVGAPYLSALAALRAGAGLATVASSANVIDKLEKRTLEIMTLRLSNEYKDSIKEIQKYIKSRKVNTIVFGPGLLKANINILKHLITDYDIPLVIDGGALTLINDVEEYIKSRKSPESIILTPHLGEFQRLFSIALPKETNELLAIAKSFTSQLGATLVLKGNPTYVLVDEQIYKNTTGGPALSTAGSGDVLSGIIGGLTAQHLLPFKAASAAVYLHGLSGDIAASENTEPAVIARDIIENLPKAMKKVSSN